MSITDIIPTFGKDDSAEIVLSYPKLAERIQGRAEEKERALKNLKEIKAEASETFLKSMETFLDATLPRLYDGIHFEDNNLNLQELVKDSCVVLVPNHQSHADYLAINYMFYKKYRIPLMVAGGNNLNIFPIGPIFRKSGCFFIRRSFQNDILYKLTLEAYLFYLLQTGKPIEFFFEGGRSRTGKLLPPKYGLYQMLLEAHHALPEEKKKKLVFVPVSIVHEYLPEQKSLAKELDGGKKVKENAAQVFGLVRLFSYQFGNVHIHLGHPVEVNESEAEHEDIKNRTQKLAFNCFFEVGRHMQVTPTSLLAMILLDEPTGAMKWNEILAKAKIIIQYCERHHIPFTQSLKAENIEKTLGRTTDILIGNRKITVIGSSSQGHVFYSIKTEARKEILYFKNTILHHFLVPWIVNMAWIELFNGRINNVDDLKRFFLTQRNQLKHEFYLPTVKEFLQKALDVISDAVGREVNGLEECMELSHKDLYAILAKVAPFARACNYINEAYYTCGVALKKLAESNKEGFKNETFLKMNKDVFEAETKLGRLIKYPESYSVPLSKSALQYYIHMKLITPNNGFYIVGDAEKLNHVVEKFENDLSQELVINFRA